jgi:hypothetical protein
VGTPFDEDHGLSFEKQLIPDIARRWRKSDAEGRAPGRLVNFALVANCQVAGRPLGNEDGVAHFPTRTTVSCFHLFQSLSWLSLSFGSSSFTRRAGETLRVRAA